MRLYYSIIANERISEKYYLLKLLFNIKFPEPGNFMLVQPAQKPQLICLNTFSIMV